MPLCATITGGARATHTAWTGQIPVEDLPAWLVLDLTIRGGLAGAGQAVGATMGLVARGPAEAAFDQCPEPFCRAMPLMSPQPG